MVGNSNRDSEFSSEKLSDALQTERVDKSTVCGTAEGWRAGEEAQALKELAAVL